MREIFRLHRIWISEDLPTASEDVERLSEVAEDFPTASDDFPTGSSKQGQQRFPKDFQPISSIIKEFRRYLIGF